MKKSDGNEDKIGQLTLEGTDAEAAEPDSESSAESDVEFSCPKTVISLASPLGQ